MVCESVIESTAESKIQQVDTPRCCGNYITLSQQSHSNVQAQLQSTVLYAEQRGATQVCCSEHGRVCLNRLGIALCDTRCSVGDSECVTTAVHATVTRTSTAHAANNDTHSVKGDSVRHCAQQWAAVGGGPAEIRGPLQTCTSSPKAVVWRWTTHKLERKKSPSAPSSSVCVTHTYLHCWTVLYHYYYIVVCNCSSSSAACSIVGCCSRERLNSATGVELVPPLHCNLSRRFNCRTTVFV